MDVIFAPSPPAPVVADDPGGVYKGMEQKGLLLAVYETGAVVTIALSGPATSGSDSQQQSGKESVTPPGEETQAEKEARRWPFQWLGGT